MSISALSGPMSSQYADTLRSAVATRAQAKPATPMDSDGDRDGSTTVSTIAAKGRLDVKM